MRFASGLVVARLMLVLLSLLAGTRLLAAGEPAARTTEQRRAAQVLFICEHGYAKSLMAATYFDQLATERGLRFRALSRGSAPNATTVPPGIATALKSEGFDIGHYRPLAVSAADVASSQRVITIGTTLPATAAVAGIPVEQWNDVPAPITYDASRAALKAHIAKLIDELESTDRTITYESRW